MRIGNFDLFEKNISDNHDLENLKNLSKGKLNNKNVNQEQKIKEADTVAKEFETLFVDMMMKSMRETVKSDDESNAQNIYKSMLDSEYSKNMTDAQSFGIREMVRDWILENNTVKKV